MFRIVFLCFLLLFLSNCSVDTKSGIWKDINKPKLNKKIVDLNFDNELSYDEFKKNVIGYGKLSNFPKLD